MDKETLDAFIERQCEQAAFIGNDDGRSGYLQAEEIQWAVDKYIRTNFKENEQCKK